MSVIEVSVSPGVISALLFIFLDIFTVGILDMVLSRIVCLSYYRNINEGRPVTVNSADIPGLSNYLLGRWISPTNLIAIGAKLALLIIVLTANMSIKSRAFVERPEVVTGKFDFEPSDKFMKDQNNSRVEPRLESSKSCIREDPRSDELVYFQLRFNLSDQPDPETDKREINDTSIICMSDENVSHQVIVATVLGCTRVIKDDDQTCLSVTSQNHRKTAKNLTRSENPGFYVGKDITHTYVEFQKDEVELTWSEYRTPRLTCLSTNIGINSAIISPSYTHCLMVSQDDDEQQTIVERWVLGPSINSSDDVFREDDFILEYPGVIFKGIVEFGRIASATYLQLPFPFPDYRTLSGELVAQASHYVELKSKDQKLDQLVRPDDNKTVTTIDVFAVGLVMGAIVIVIVGYVVTLLLLRQDTRPRFNTINGLSSIVREEHVPSGRSYACGDSAILGLHFTSNDNLHFGPLRDRGEGTAYQHGYDIS